MNHKYRHKYKKQFNSSNSLKENNKPTSICRIYCFKILRLIQHVEIQKLNGILHVNLLINTEEIFLEQHFCELGITEHNKKYQKQRKSTLGVNARGITAQAKNIIPIIIAVIQHYLRLQSIIVKGKEETKIVIIS